MTCMYKYPFSVSGDAIEIEMKCDAQIQSVELVRNKMVIYAIVDTDNKTTVRKFRTVGAGEDHPINNSWTFLKTFVINTVPFHLFEC